MKDINKPTWSERWKNCFIWNPRNALTARIQNKTNINIIAKKQPLKKLKIIINPLYNILYIIQNK